MNGAPRTIPTVTAHYRDGRWTVTLPDGREFQRKRASGIERIVERELAVPRSAIRWSAGEA